MTDPMFSRIKLAVKGTTGEFSLTRFNAIVGENRAGKTSIHDALMLALTGKHAIGRYAKDIGGLIPNGANRMFVELVTTEKQAKGPTFECWKDGDKFKMDWRPNILGPNPTQPFGSFRELIDMSSSLSREAIFTRFGNDIAFPPAAAESEHIEQAWAELWDKTDVGSPCAKLAELRRAIRSEKQSNSIKKGALNTVLAMLRADGSDVGGETLPAMWSGLRHAIELNSSETIAAMRNGVEAAIEAKTYGKVFAKVEQELERFETRNMMLKSLEGRATRRMDYATKVIAERATAAVNANITHGFHAAFTASVGSNEADLDEYVWTVTGRDGRPHRGAAISGAERSVLALALARAWTDGQTSPFGIFDDEVIGPFHSSPQSLQAFLRSIEDAVEKGQIGMVSVAGLRRDEVPVGWSIILLE